MPRLKERLDETGDNGLSTRDGDEDGFILYETSNNRHFVYIYYSEIDEIINLLNNEKSKFCKSKGKTNKKGNSAQARELSQMQKSNKKVSNKRD